MKKEETIIRDKNLKFSFIGYFFVSLSAIFITFFLPYYLKEKGLSILEIGALLTLGIAVGDLILSSIFGKIQKKISLKKGLYFTGLFSFLYSFIFVVFPSALGVIFSKISGEIKKVFGSISMDVTLQHNSNKKNHKKVGSYYLVIDSFAYLVGLFLSIFLINKIGFSKTLFIFAILALPCFFFFNKINEKHRFKSDTSWEKLKISKNLKLLSLAENLYWFALSASFTLVITFLITDYFSSSINWIAYLFGGLYLSIVLSTFFTKKIFEKKSLIFTSIFGMAFQLIGVFMIIFSNNLYVVLGAMVMEGIGAGIWVPAKTAMYWKLTKPELREKASSYLLGRRVFASAIGPLFGGLLATYLGILSPFYFRGIIILFAIGIYVYLKKEFRLK